MDMGDNGRAAVDEERIKQIRYQLERQGVGYERLHDWRDISYWLVPVGRSRYIPWFTTIIVCLMLFLFWFMAGAYDLYLLMEKAGAAPRDVDMKQYEFAAAYPSSLVNWITLAPTRKQQFQFDYLLQWGARYGPQLVKGQWWRWFTSLCLHASFRHLLPNMLLLLALSLHLEQHYGTWRILLVWVLSGVGGNVTSAIFGNACELVVGSSGAVFGLFGLFAADLVLNFESISRPFLRLVFVLAVLLFALIAQFTDNSSDKLEDSGQGFVSVNHWSHLGGLVSGLFPSFLFMPNIQDKRWRAARNVARAIGLYGEPSGGSAATQPPSLAQSGPAGSGDRASGRGSRASDRLVVATSGQGSSQQSAGAQQVGGNEGSGAVGSGPIDAQLRERVDNERSVWSRLPVNPLVVVGGLVSIAVFIVGPIYVYSVRLSGLECDG